MDVVIQEWAGKERSFRLNFGAVLDLEQALGGEGIGHVFIRVASGKFRALDIYCVLKFALIGGGMAIMDAKRLVDAHFDQKPYLENASLAGEILTALMAGVEADPEADPEDRTGEVPPPYKFSEVSQICREFSISPVELREMRYSDFANMMRGYVAAKGSDAPSHISEDEFADILNRYEPEVP